MQKVTLDDVVGLERYEQLRDEFRKRIIALKKVRRITVGDCISFVFENHDTALFQIQEMMRAEHITDLDNIRNEIFAYNELLPEDNELSATMLIEITEQDQIRPRLVSLIGIDNAVSLQIGSQCTIPGIFEAGRSKEDNLSAVQYVRFPFSEEARQALQDERNEVVLVVDHPNYRARTILSHETLQSLAAEL